MAPMPNSPKYCSRPPAVNSSQFSPSHSRLSKLARRTWTKALSATALAGLTVLGAQEAQAACSKEINVLLGSSAALAGNIPDVGGPLASGLSLINLFLCGGETPVILSEDDVKELIRSELDDDAAERARRNFKNVEDEMNELGLILSIDFDDLEFDELDADQIRDVQAAIDDVRDFIEISETDFSVPLTASNNNRASYDLSASIVLAHYKLFLGALEAKSSQGELATARIISTANVITLDFDKYEAEALRLRDLELRIDHQQFGSSPGRHEYTPVITRQGTELFVGATRSCVPNPTIGCPALDAAQTGGHNELARMHEAFDRQDRQIALIKARAAAMSVDPFVDLSTVTVEPPPTSVMLGIRAESVQEKCVVFKGGGHTADGDLVGGEIQLADCDPALSRQQWFLDDDGRIRSSVADLCVQATNNDNKIFALPCGESTKQVWTRDGNLLKVSIDGSNRCMKKSKGKDILRHKPCSSSKERMHYFAFSPLHSGEVSEFLGFGPVNPSTAEILGVEFDEANLADDGFDPGLCVGEENLVSLRVCDRYAANQYWAQDGGGSFRPMLRRNKFLNVSQSDEIGLKSSGSQLTVVTRGEVADGVFLFFNAAGNSVFAGAFEAGARLFADALVVDGNGDPEEFTLWRHFNGGKFVQ